MAEITDPDLLKQLNSGEITDPKVLARLNEEPNRGVLDRVAGGVGAIGHGVLEGGAHLLGLPGDIIQAILKTPPQPGDFPTTQDIKDSTSRLMTKVGNLIPGFEGDLGQVYKPQNQLEQYISKGAEGVASTVGPGMPLKLGAALGAASGIGGEAAAQAFGDTANNDTLGREVGTAAPLVAGGTAALNPKLAASAFTYTIPSLAWPPALSKALMGVKTGMMEHGKAGMIAAIVKSILQQNQGQ